MSDGPISRPSPPPLVIPYNGPRSATRGERAGWIALAVCLTLATIGFVLLFTALEFKAEAHARRACPKVDAIADGTHCINRLTGVTFNAGALPE